MAGFTKLWSDIVYSTIWREDMPTKIVWITMLAMSDRNGIVRASLPGLADAARVSLEQCVEALRVLASPDPYSRTRKYEGRRIEDVEGGWLLLTFRDHRDKRSAEENRLRGAERVRRYRERHRPVTEDVTHVTQSNPIAEAEADTDTPNSIVGLTPNVPVDKPGKPDGRTQQALEVLQFLNQKTGKNFRGLDGNGRPTSSLRAIMDRLKTGCTPQDCKTLIARKVRDWAGDDRMRPYLRPSTLFRASNFEDYLGECVAR